MKIIGVDPGLVSTGWGVIELKGTSLSFIGCGTIGTKKDQKLSERLLHLHRELTSIITQYMPTHAALEETFVSVNGASTLKLGQARGALLVTLAAADLPVSEYAAKAVKKALVGNGSAEKHQVSQMVGVLLPAAREPLTACKHDAADALALAICAANSVRNY